MTEQQLCEYIDKYNFEIENTYPPPGPKHYIDAEEKMEMLDDLIAMHDSDQNSPIWCEASAQTSDGETLWARRDARTYLKQGYPLRIASRLAQADAQVNAIRLASER